MKSIKWSTSLQKHTTKLKAKQDHEHITILMRLIVNAKQKAQHTRETVQYKQMKRRDSNLFLYEDIFDESTTSTEVLINLFDSYDKNHSKALDKTEWTAICTDGMTLFIEDAIKKEQRIVRKNMHAKIDSNIETKLGSPCYSPNSTLDDSEKLAIEVVCQNDLDEFVSVTFKSALAHLLDNPDLVSAEMKKIVDFDGDGKIEKQEMVLGFRKAIEEELEEPLSSMHSIIEKHIALVLTKVLDKMSEQEGSRECGCHIN